MTNGGGDPAPPPRFVTRILRAALPDDRRGRSILGDLLEEWHRRPPGAHRTWWYLGEVVALAARYVFVGRRLPGLPVAPGGASGGRSHHTRRLDERIADDGRQAVRRLARDIGFTGTAVAVLALGIGTATAVFSAYRAVVLDDLPVGQPERLVHVSFESLAGAAVTLTAEEVERLAVESRSLSNVGGVAAFGAGEFPLSVEGRSLELGTSTVTANLFRVLDIRPALGRTLRTEDGYEGAARVTVITHDAWHRDFGGDPEVLGRALLQTQTQRSYTIVGVAPPGLDLPAGVGYWIPVGPRGAPAIGRSSMDVIGRLASAATPDMAAEELLSIVRSLDAERPRPRSPERVTVRPLSEAVLGDVKPMLSAITASVVLLLLIACFNVGNLFLIRTNQRSRELLVRRALGAGLIGIVRLQFIEAALVAMSAGVLGLILATWLTGLLPVLAPGRLPRSDMIGLSGTPIAIAAGITAAALLLTAVVPGILVAKGTIATGLRGGSSTGAGSRGNGRARRALVGLQVALAVVSLFGAGLVMRSLQRLQSLDLGYATDNVGIVEVTLDRRGRGPAETFELLAGLLERVRSAPGVSSATWIMSRPFVGSTGVLSVHPALEGQTDAEVEDGPTVPVEVGGSELLRTLGISLIRGRGLRDTDHEDSPRVAVVSEAVAGRLWPGEDPLGKRMRFMTSRAQWWTVVGVAGDTRFRHLREPTPTIYVHYRQLQVLPAVWTMAVRANDKVLSVLPGVGEALAASDPGVDVWRAGALSDHLDRGPLSTPRISGLLLSGFGLVALGLASIGLYGVLALAVRERTHELGLRRALGASTHRLRWQVVGEAVRLAGVGTTVGLGLALFFSRRLDTLLFDIGPLDPTTVLTVSAALVATAVFAAFLPARRATAVDPMEALRAE